MSKTKKNKQNHCPECGRKIKPWMDRCYKHHHKKKKNYNPKRLSEYHGGTK